MIDLARRLLGSPGITVAAIIIIAFTLAVVPILLTVYAYEPYQVRIPTWQAPDIEQCDKELWLRIRNGCGENHE